MNYKSISTIYFNIWMSYVMMKNHKSNFVICVNWKKIVEIKKNI